MTRRKGFYLTFFSLIATLFLAVVVLEQCKPGTSEVNAGDPVKQASFVGDQSCQSCHAKEHADWQLSDHIKAMQPANDSTVLGDFNNRTYTSEGVKNRFYKQDGKFFIETSEIDGSKSNYEVLYTFGFKPLQQYLVAFPDGRMQVTRASWDTDKKRWFHQYSGQRLQPGDWLHWTRGGQNWNTMCASCHSTNLVKGYDANKDQFNTTYSTIHVSCESCHGPASRHLEYVASDAYKNGEKQPGAFLRGLKGNDVRQMNTCMPCHARKTNLSQDPQFSMEIMDEMIPEIPRTEYFHADGQVDDEDFIYTSFLQSKMYHRGVTCRNCHNPHSGKLIQMGNATCLSCHEKKFEGIEHTGHQPSLTQVNCVSCHMPGKLYMENDLRHDHSFRVPRPDLSVKYGTPNACNNCHKDKSAQWSADAVKKWFGPERKYHFSEDLIPGSQGNAASLAHLRKLTEDTAVPSIIKATAVYYLEQVPGQAAVELLLKSLRDKDPQVRYRALNNLDPYQGSSWVDAAGPLLSDPVKAVRIAAADLFLLLPPDQVPVAFREHFGKAKMELQQYLFSQLDFASGNLGMADFYLKQNDYANAERFYLRGLKQDSMMNYARFNLSSMYNAQSRNNDALRVLTEAERTDPANPRVNYQLALLLVEMNQREEAEKQFRKAIDRKYTDPRLYYNYGVLIQQQGKAKEAERIFREGIRFQPMHEDLNYALAFLLMQMKREAEAREPARVLKQINPDNPDYQPLFRQLRI